jgi:hypothetical protein
MSVTLDQLTSFNGMCSPRCRTVSMLVAICATLTLVAPPAGGAGSRSSRVVGTPVAFIYHAVNEGPDHVVVGVWMTVARKSRTGRYTRDQIHRATLKVGGFTTMFRLGLGDAPAVARGACFLATQPTLITTRLGSKRPGDRVQVTLTILGQAFTRSLVVRRGNINGSSRSEERTVHAAGCRRGGAELRSRN